MRLFSVLAAVTAALLLSGVAGAQTEFNFNVSRLATLDEHTAFADIWGYHAPDGREYALVGHTQGTAVVNVTDPTNPYEVRNFAWTNCTWRDIKSRGQYVYIVNDCSGGVQVVDMQNPENPQLVNEFGGGYFNHAHNVFVDEAGGTLWVCGTSRGTVIYDLAANPVNPPRIRDWNGQGIQGFFIDGYVHDLYVADGLAYVCMIYDGLFAILDVSNLPSISVLSQKKSGDQFTHSIWVNDEATTAVVCDETGGTRHIQTWDVTDKQDPVQGVNLTLGIQTLPHNPFIVGDTAYVSYYKWGFVAYDIADPFAIEIVGRYETFPGDPGSVGFNGAWGVFVQEETGFIYVNDITSGLNVLWMHDPCSADPTGRPALCESWPDEVLPGETPNVLIGGVDLTDVTAVHVGNVTLGAGQFDVVDDQAIAFTLPAGLPEGLITIQVQNAFGLSGEVYTQVRAAGHPELITGASSLTEGDEFVIQMDSQPGDLLYLGLSFTAAPSTVNNKVTYDIGDSFADMFLLPPIPTDGSGGAVLPPIEIPAGAAGITVLWQYAAVGQAGLPAPVSNVSINSVN